MQLDRFLVAKVWQPFRIKIAEIISYQMESKNLNWWSPVTKQIIEIKGKAGQ